MGKEIQEMIKEIQDMELGEVGEKFVTTVKKNKKLIVLAIIAGLYLYKKFK